MLMKMFSRYRDAQTVPGTAPGGNRPPDPRAGGSRFWHPPVGGRFPPLPRRRPLRQQRTPHRNDPMRGSMPSYVELRGAAADEVHVRAGVEHPSVPENLRERFSAEQLLVAETTAALVTVQRLDCLGVGSRPRTVLEVAHQRPED